MTKWGRKFLNSLFVPGKRKGPGGWEYNSRRANELVGIPRDLIDDLQLEAMGIDPSWETNHLTFVAGVIIGWNEAKKVKK